MDTFVSPAPIVNLTQHPATPEQRAVGVVDLPDEQRARLCELLTVPAEVVLNANLWSGESTRRVREIVSLTFPYVLREQRSLLLREGGDAPPPDESSVRQHQIWHLTRTAYGVRAMVGGAPFLVPLIAAELRRFGIEPLLAVSDRATVEEPQPDGSVRKAAVFRHAGLVSHP